MPEFTEDDIADIEGISGIPVAPPQIVAPPQTAGFMYGSSRYENEPPVPRPTGAQLNALPFDTLTNLPSGGWGVRESVEHRQRLQEFERQAQQARQAAESAARDAQMLDQMSRAAHSMKDIENARHQIDVMSLQRELSSLGPAATPAQYAATMMRHPLAAGSAGLAAALRAAETIAPPTRGTVSGVGDYLVDSAGKPHFRPASSMTEPLSTEAVPITDPSGRVLGYRAPTGPRSGTVLDRTPLAGSMPAEKRITIDALRDELKVVEKNIVDNALLPKMKPKIEAWEKRANELRGQLSEFLPQAFPKVEAPRSMAVMGQGTREDPARPMTKAQFDSMPSGAFFVNPADGKLRQKK